MQLSGRVMQVLPSPTLAIDAKAKALKAAGEKVLSLAAGEPDFATPEPICKAAVRALEQGHTKYAPSAGIPSLRDAIRRRYREDHGLEFSDDQVVVSCGAKHCLYNAFQSLMDPGTEAIIQTPYWVSYPEQVRLAGGTPILIPPTGRGFGLHLEAISKAINKATRVIVLNSPNNPTGQVISNDELDAVAQMARRWDLTVISDDIYDQILYDGIHLGNIGKRNPDMRDKILLVNGVSKSYSMTGWRLGYAVGPKELIGAMRKVQDQSTSNATTFVQHAAVEALALPKEFVSKMVMAFDERRLRAIELLNAIEGISCDRPTGAFYAFPCVSKILERKLEGKAIGSSLHLADLLLERERVALVPGEAFGAPGYIRISFAASMSVIEEAMARLSHFVEGLD